MDRFILSFVTIGFITACSTNKEAEKSFVISGDIAYDVTAYVEKYWRVVGNSGFDSSIYKVVNYLEKAGYTRDTASDLYYTIQKRALEKPTWVPESAFLVVAGDTLLKFATNRNMIAINSYSTDAKSEIISIKREDISNLSSLDVKDKIVYGQVHPYDLYKSAVLEGGATGIITYSNPEYLKPETNKTSIQFRSIPYNPDIESWCLALSYEANEKLNSLLKNDSKEAHVMINTRMYPSEELTLIAEVRGSEYPGQRLVYSAHVQEPGANDNASGVGASTEMAYILGKRVAEEGLPKRTITFLWGDEISSTRRYIQEDSLRAENIKWGISLDMVGENTSLTGGSFLIEKMPDPSAVWTRGNDKHSEWGGSPLSLEDMMPHYLNDFMINRFEEHGKKSHWEVNYNPFEGGSDHVPFLRANIPGLLLWHFTDQFYHTDNDRIDKVSKSTLKNVATVALNSGLYLANAGIDDAGEILDNTKKAGIERLREELRVSRDSLLAGQSHDMQIEIITAWKNWYDSALQTTADLVEDRKVLSGDIQEARAALNKEFQNVLKNLDN